MFCRKCGKRLEDNSKFCSFCGEKIILEEAKNETIVEEKIVQSEYVQPCYSSYSENGPWKVFAPIGMGLGILNMFLCFIPIINIYVFILFGEIGIVLSSLGLKSFRNHGMARTGLILNIIGLVLSFILFIYYEISDIKYIFN